MGKKTSKTEKCDREMDWVVGGHHHKTTISDGNRSVSSCGNTSKESEKRASDKWDKGSSGNSGGSSSSGGGGSSGKSGCYLTTACVDYKGLTDNCEELEIIREFRDTYMARSPEGRALTREYYDIAPRIVEAINMREDRGKIYDGIFNDVVLPAVAMIRNGRNEEAMRHYESSVRGLEAQLN